MRTVGRRIDRPISFSASTDLLREGGRFNEEIHRLPTGAVTMIPKGIYRFKSHEDANRQQRDAIVASIVCAVREFD